MQAFPPRSVSEAPHSATAFGAGGYVNPFVTAASHGAQYAPMARAGVGALGAGSLGGAAPGAAHGAAAAGLLPRSLTDKAVAGGFDPPSLLGRSASHAMGPFQFKFEAGPGPLADATAASSGDPAGPAGKGPFQFTFEPGPGPLVSEATGGSSGTGAAVSSEWPPDARGEPPAAAAVPQQPPQPQVQLPAPRGRDGVLRRQANATFGSVAQEPVPVGCNMQLDECVARCRQEVQALAAECQRHGTKFSDPDFPADERALCRNGRFPDGPVNWRRASEGATPNATSSAGGQALHGTGEMFLHGHFNCVTMLSALAAVRAVGKDPRELIVWQEPEAGIYGVRLFKDGEWMYEVLDDLLPLSASGQPLFSRAVSAGGEASDWLALIEKAYAKVHGCYEAVAEATEEEALEDISGAAAGRVPPGDFQIWGELWRHLRTRRRRGFLQVAMRRVEAPGETLTSGLVSGYGYPIARLEMVEGQMLCELRNPWPVGAWRGQWGAGSPEAYRLGPLAYNAASTRSFWMSIQDFVKNFTDIFDARLVPSSWQSSVLPLSSEHATSALVSAAAKTQAIFALTQSDRRWCGQERECPNAIGLRIYRCRIVAPPQNAVGLRQNVSNPFSNMELVAERPPARVHSVVIELPHLEPACLYIASVEAQQPFSWAVLRLLTASPPRLRELSPPETSYFVDAQAMAAPALDNDSFSSQGSVELQPKAAAAPGAAHPRIDPMKRNVDGADGWDWGPDGGEAIKLPLFLQACMASCSGEC